MNSFSLCLKLLCHFWVRLDLFIRIFMHIDWFHFVFREIESHTSGMNLHYSVICYSEKLNLINIAAGLLQLIAQICFELRRALPRVRGHLCDDCGPVHLTEHWRLGWWSSGTWDEEYEVVNQGARKSHRFWEKLQVMSYIWDLKIGIAYFPGIMPELERAS